MADYILEGPRWGAGARGTSGGTVTWAIDGTIPVSFVNIIQSAFSAWASYGNINFQQGSATSAANIKFTLDAIDGQSNILATTNYSYVDQTMKSATVKFDTGESWHPSSGKIISSQGADLYVVALHEIGHAIGLDHYNAKTEVMNSYISPAVVGLMAGDIAGVQAIYGLSSAAPSVAPAVGPIATHVADPGPVSSGTGSGVTAVHRFFDTATGDHFYTLSTAEKTQIQASLPTYKYEGVGWATPSDGPDTTDVFRFFDTATNQHFFTSSAAERDQIIKSASTYHYEGVAFEVYAHADATGSGAVTLERFFNTNTGMHHYAANADEAYGINHGSAGAGWVDEGKAFTVHVPTDSMLFA